MHRKSFQVLDESGVGNLYTLCHGDLKEREDAPHEVVAQGAEEAALPVYQH